jgi:hypothetical protein
VSFLERNLAALEGRRPELAAKLRRLAADEGTGADGDAPALELKPTRTGRPSATLRGAWLHSRYDPVAEAKAFADASVSASTELALLFGFGLGYATEALLAAGVSVVAVEPELGVLREALAVRELGGALSSPLLTILVADALDGTAGGTEELEAAVSAAIDGIEPRSLRWAEHPAYARLYPAEAERLRSLAARYTEKDRINEATLRRFGRRWVRNLAANAALVPLLPGIAELRDAYRGLPALILAAGPSLDEALPYLGELRERALVISVDTALRSALRAGVEPDYTVVVDPQYWNARHLDRCYAPRCALVTEPAVWPSALRGRWRARYLCSSLYPLGRYLEERCGKPKGALGAGGSVSTSAWDFARQLGCSPIYLAGLDLSFPGGHTHARASLFEQRALAEGERLRPASDALFAAMRGGRPYRAPANDGGTVVSDRRLSLYAWWFESRAARHPETRSRTLSRGGLRIAGLPLAELEELLALPPRRAEIDAIGARLTAAASEGWAEASASGALAGLVAELRRVEGLCLRGLALAESGDLDGLAALDAELLASEAKDVAGFLFSSVDELVGVRATNLEQSMAQSTRLYRALAESARWHAELLGSSGLN